MGWIQEAIKHKNTFRRYCGGKVTLACIRRGCKSKNPTTKKRACLAKTLAKLRKRR